MTDTIAYVYAVVRGADEQVVAGIAGVGGTRVRLVGAGDLQAVVSDVDRAEFEAHALDEHLEDLTWLTLTARAHHHVVDAVGRSEVVAPLSLATVYFDDDRVREVLDVHHDAFTGVLDRLRGRAEWGVKAWLRPGAPKAGPAAAKPRSGADYLRSRRDALRSTEADDDEIRAEADALHGAVAELADEERRLRIQDATLAGTTDRMVLNGAYLVPATSAVALTRLVDSFAEHPRMRVELTGPWVPYSFAQAGA